MSTFRDDRHCFVCGEKNENGLRLEWTLAEDEGCLRTRFCPDERWQGWRGVVHGGIVTAVLDEAMVSAELEVRFKEPAPVDSTLIFEGSARRRHRKLYGGESTCYRDGDGTVVAQATSKLMQVEAEVPELWQNE